MFKINKLLGQRILELGGGEGRTEGVDCNVDLVKSDSVDFVADFNQPLPMQDSEWDGIICRFCLEHLSFLKTLDFLKEVHRICKDGANVVFTTPNTEKQIEWIKEHPEGWDGDSFFISASKVLFGGQDAVGNFHSSYLSPTIAIQLFSEAGFENVKIQPFNERQTDMMIEANKPKSKVVIPPAEKTVAKHVRPIPVKGVPLREVLQPEESKLKFQLSESSINPSYMLQTEEPKKELLKALRPLNEDRASLFDREYFNGGKKVGGYAHEGYSDFPCHWTTAKKILERNPKSVVELGAARGNIVKRLIDAGVPSVGLEISKHCYLTRVTNAVQQQDICNETWGPFWVPESGRKPFSHALSCAVFEHVPEEYLPVVLSNLRNISEAGLHGIDFGEADSGFDKTHCLLKNFSWWRSKFDEFGLQSHEIVDKEALEDQKYFPQEVLQSTNGFKINLGCGLNQFWHGWINVDSQDLSQWSAGRGHHFFKHDIRNGLAPFATAGVDAIFLGNILEMLDYNQCNILLRECRRVIKPTGQIRISVMDAEKVQSLYRGDCQGLHISDFNEYSETVANARTCLQKMYALLNQGKQSVYDDFTIHEMVRKAGFTVDWSAAFRWGKEVMESGLDLNLFLTASPTMGI